MDNRQIDYRAAAVKHGVADHFTLVVGNEVTTDVGHFNIFPVPAGDTVPDFRAKDWKSVFGSIAVYVNRERYRELIPYVVATTSAVQMFFLYLMVVHKNPFTTYLANVPADGEGLNPLLQNYWMAIHPPSLYTGFVGMTIPFAFGIAALATGHLDDAWLRAVRRWTMFAWLFLSFGLLFAGANAAEQKPDCCATKLACCAKDKACCGPTAKKVAPKEGKGCCGQGKCCCGA